MFRIYLLTGVLSASVSAQVIFTEVMYNPRGSENSNEFIEVFNLNETDSVSLQGWMVGDQTAVDEIIAFDSGLTLAPRSYALILDPAYFESEKLYDELIPDSVLIVTIDDNTLGSGGLSNSRVETIRLFDPFEQVVAEYAYSLGNDDGFSDEKVELTMDDSAENWSDAQVEDGTPGFRNSVAPHQIDGEVIPTSLLIEPAQLRQGHRAQISIMIRNAGLGPIRGPRVEYDLTPQGREFGPPVFLGTAASERAIASDDTLRLELTTDPLEVGSFVLAAQLQLAGDTNSRNDTLTVPLAVGWRRQVVVLNEIMFKPAEEQAEWIEVFNPQAFSVPLPGWAILDEVGNEGKIEQLYFVPPRQYRVLTASPASLEPYSLSDSVVIGLAKLPSLNNSGDMVILRDFSGAVIDSIFYEGDWGETGKSIEKIWYERDNQRANWSVSTASAGATPGAFNSVSPKSYDLELRLLEFEPARPAHDTPVELRSWVCNRGRNPSRQFEVEFLFDPAGRGDWQSAQSLGRIRANQTILAEDSLLLSLRWQFPPPGRNLIRAQVIDEQDVVPGNNHATGQVPVGYEPGSVVINEIHYAPASGQIEWFEVYNASNAAVDLQEWLWKDQDSERTVAIFAEGEQLLSPRGFAVIAEQPDAEIAASGATVFIPENWPTLNNDEDGIALWDFNGGFQDSVRFAQEWGGGNDFSLERINPLLGSQDSTNWSTCVDAAGSTPGRANSIFTAIIPASVTMAVSPNPFSPDHDGVDDFVIIQVNLPVTTATANLRIYDLRGRLVKELLNNRPVGATHEVVWNGMDDSNRPARTGIYIAHLEAIKADEGILLNSNTTLVLARRLN